MCNKGKQKLEKGGCNASELSLKSERIGRRLDIRIFSEED